MAHSPLLPLIYGRLGDIKVIKRDLKDAIEEKEQEVTTFDTYDDAVRAIKILQIVNVLFALECNLIDGHLYAIPSSEDQDKSPYSINENGDILVNVGEGDTLEYSLDNGHLFIEIPE